jgi:transcriptional regulator of acetoin/glycerol metabolism
MRETPLQGISRLSEEAARSHNWPGGGRELRTRLKRGIEGATGEYLQPVDLFPERMATADRIMTLAEARDIAERRQIIDALVRSGGRVGKAAIILEVSRTTLWQKMQKLEIPSGSD